MFNRLVKRWEISASTGSHFEVLDGLRGVAILLVVLCHAFYSNPSQGSVARLFAFIIEAGWMGVPIFFVLSGFLISYPFFQKRQTDPQFWNQRGYFWRRLGKILPPFYLSLVVYSALFWWDSGNPDYFKSALIWATGLGNFVLTNPPFNEYYWSLLVESHFYFVLPGLIWLLRGLNVRQLTVALFLVLFFVPLLARCLTWPPGVYVFDGLDRNMHLLLKRFPTQLDYFSWGVLMAGLHTSIKPALNQLKALSLLGYVGAALLLLALYEWGLWQQEFNIRVQPTLWADEVRHFLPAVCAFLMLFFIFDPDCLGARCLSAGWLRFTGIISYEWFLIHPPVCHWFLAHSGHSNGNMLAYAWKTFFPVLFTFFLSALVYRYFSLPILNWTRERLKAIPKS